MAPDEGQQQPSVNYQPSLPTSPSSAPTSSIERQKVSKPCCRDVCVCVENGRNCDRESQILLVVQQLIDVDKLFDAKNELKAALDDENTCHLIAEKWREVECLCERRMSSTTDASSIEPPSTIDTASSSCGVTGCPSGSEHCGSGCLASTEESRRDSNATCAASGACDASVAGGDSAKSLTESELHAEPCDEFDCVLCMKLLYEPVTLPCGHTFCKMCLARVTDYASACPICRTVLHLDDPTRLPQSVVLARIIQRYYPQQYEQRRLEMQADTCTGDTFKVPLFALKDAVVFPGQNFPMHIFEPRYRLMLRRVMSGARKFGLVNFKRTGDGSLRLADHGALLEVRKAERTPDGRSIIDTSGVGRFRVLEHEQLDGYTMGKVEMYNDCHGLEGDEVKQFERKARRLISELLNRGGRCPTMQNALQRTGEVPRESCGVSALSLWLAGALEIDPVDRQRLFEMNDAAARLREMCQCLERYHRNRLCPYSGIGRSRECVLQ